METHEVLQEVIDAQLEQGSQSVSEVKRGVPQRIRTMSDDIRTKFGAAGDGVLGELELAADRWQTTIHYGDSITVDDISSKGAAGMHNLSSRETTLDRKAFEVKRDKEYWKRVEAHEVEGHGKQAANFNTGSITYGGQQATLTDLVEWDAITTANQPDSDLTADYKQHCRIGEEVAAIVGAGVLRSALQTGDLRSVQEKIQIAELRTQLGISEDVVIGTG